MVKMRIKLGKGKGYIYTAPYEEGDHKINI